MDGADFSSLPEGCISHVLSLTSPRDVCRSRPVSSTVRSASDSDAVWEKFLPSDYAEIVSRSVSPLTFSSKEELYFRLCDDPIVIDEGKKSLGLDKSNGKKCYMLASRELSIIWVDDPSYWRWISLPDSRFSEVAELLNVCWFEICGKIESRLLSPKTTYVASIVFKFSSHITYGLENTPIELSVRLGSQVSQRIVYLKRYMEKPQARPMRHREIRLHEQVRNDYVIPQDRSDGWKEIAVGEFFNDEGDDGEVEMSLKEVKVLNWKGGLIIQGIEVRPKI